MRRTIVSAILLPLLILYIMKLSAGWYAGLLVFSAFVALIEFTGMYRLSRPLKTATVLTGPLTIAVYYLRPEFAVYAFIFSLMALMSVRLFSVKDPSGALKDMAPAVVGLFYIPLLMLPQVNIRLIGPEWTIFYYGATWGADGMAYYVGSTMGKRKLYESVSPKKTVEGAIGSVIGGAMGTLVLLVFMDIKADVITALAIGFAVGAVAIIGDLVESMLKRDADIKDSGGLIPGGHGGFLDKMDSGLFSGPVFLAVYHLMK